MTRREGSFVRFSDEARARIEEVRRHAERPENWWHPMTREEALQMDYSAHRVMFDFRCKAIYTVEVTEQGPCKHLSVSLWEGDDENNLVPVPPFLVFTLATLFGIHVGDTAFMAGRLPGSDPMLMHVFEPMGVGDVPEA